MHPLQNLDDTLDVAQEARNLLAILNSAELETVAAERIAMRLKYATPQDKHTNERPD